MTRFRHVCAKAICVVMAVWAGAPAFSPARADTTLYFYNAGRRIPIERAADRIALRVREGESGRVADLLSALSGIAGVRDIRAGALVEVSGAGIAARPVAALRSAIEEFQGEVLPVFQVPGTTTESARRFITDEFLVSFRQSVPVGEVARLNERHGVEIVDRLSYVQNGFKLRVVDGDLDRNALTVANTYFETGLCLFAHPNFLESRKRFFAPNDPAYPAQWHLKNVGSNGGRSGADVNAEAAWDITRGSSSITVAVADTGIDFLHRDFNVDLDGIPKVVAPRDVVHGDSDPSPSTNEPGFPHGTAAAGVAVAAGNNGLDGSGIAPGCRLMPIQLYAESTFTPNATEADAFTWAADNGADVMTNSWGPDFADTPLPDVTRAAIDHATSTGRDGKGMVIFMAAGNQAMDVARNKYAAYDGVVAVAASTNLDLRASYSNFGDAISVAAPSSGGSLAITTSDVTGQPGYSGGDTTANFGGTSSACPLAAGVAALMLSANPDLTWGQVRDLLERSSDVIDPANGQYDGMGHSALYGKGRVNAFEAVRRAMAADVAVELVQRVDSAPAGGEYQIQWMADAPGGIATQTLDYSTDGRSFTGIATLGGSDRSFTWTVPALAASVFWLRLSVTDTLGRVVATTSAILPGAGAPAITNVKAKRSSSGRLQLVVDGEGIRVDDTVILIDGVELTSIKYPPGKQTGNGNATRVLSKDTNLDALVPRGTAVTVMLQSQSTGAVSAGVRFAR